MKVIDTINLVIKVDGKGDSVQAVIAYAATITSRMIKLPHRLEDLEMDHIGTC